VSERDAALSALGATASRVSSLLRSANDPSVRLPHLEWTIGDLGAHLVSIIRAYSAAAQGEAAVGPDVAKRSENNARLIASTPERSLNDLADALDIGTAEFVAANEMLEREQRVPFYGDLTITAAGAARAMLFDQLVHGWDIATTLARRWNIDASDARLALDALPEVLPLVPTSDAARGFTATLEMRIRGSRPYFLIFDDGVLTVAPDRGVRRVDCHISAAPSPYLLVSAGRGSRWRPVLTGRIITYGRRPWLANKVKTIFGPL
jgi:uncharacterized protein (TIGR03083 family)